MEDKRIPLVIITGFLGSGKTTLINNLLNEIDKKRIAIIENEFAQLGIDSSLINKKKGSNVYELNNGCVCCTMNGELEGVFEDLVSNKDNWDYVLLETTGVADPSPIISNLISNYLVSENFRLDSVYTLVDSKNFLEQINREFETKKQVIFANKIIVNKVDLVKQEKLKKIKETIIKINPDSQIIETSFSKIDLKNIFHEESFNISRVDEIKNSFQFFSFSNSNTSSIMTNNSNHTNDIDSFGISFKEKISLPKFDFFIRTLISMKGKDIYRTKGIVNIDGANQPIIFQGVHDIIDWFPGPPWESEEERETKMVFIGKGLNKKEIETGLKELMKVQE